MAQGELSKIGNRLKAVRFRTYILTAIIVVVLFFYYMVNVSTRQSIAWIDFILLCVVQFVTHFIYYPDGQLFGQKNPSFIANRQKYNENAEKVNSEDQHEDLREFCEWDYQQRKKKYVLTQCGYIGISLRELEAISKMTKKEIKEIEEYRWTEKVGDKDVEKVVKFSRRKRKLLYDLIYKPIPVEKNDDATILSAVDNTRSEKIKDESKGFNKRAHIRRALWIVLIGTVMSYVIYTVRDNFGLAEIVQIIMCIFSLVGTAITSYNTGEISTTRYKSVFYLELGNFLDEFFEWDRKQKQKEQK